jgi:hypothetical protein
MVGDYISTSWLNGRAWPAFAVASARVGRVFDEPIAVPIGGLVAATGGFVNNSSGEHPVADAASDHASPRSPIRRRYRVSGRSCARAPPAPVRAPARPAPDPARAGTRAPRGGRRARAARARRVRPRSPTGRRGRGRTLAPAQGGTGCTPTTRRGPRGEAARCWPSARPTAATCCKSRTAALSTARAGTQNASAMSSRVGAFPRFARVRGSDGEAPPGASRDLVRGALRPAAHRVLVTAWPPCLRERGVTPPAARDAPQPRRRSLTGWRCC